MNDIRSDDTSPESTLDGLDPSWDEVMENKELKAVTHGTPSNVAPPHTDEDDRQILERMDKDLVWLRPMLDQVYTGTSK